MVIGRMLSARPRTCKPEGKHLIIAVARDAGAPSSRQRLVLPLELDIAAEGHSELAVRLS
jgi:hypothetical protein